MSTDDFLDKDYIKKELKQKREQKIREACSLVGINSPLLTANEVCDILKISRSGLRGLALRTVVIGEPNIQSTKKGKVKTRRMIRYMAKDIQDYIFSRIETR